MPVSDLVRLYLQQIDRRPYVVCSDVVEDRRLVSVRASGPGTRQAVFAVLRAHGVDVTERAGTVFVCGASVPSGSPLASPGRSYSTEAAAPAVEEKEKPRERVHGKLELAKQKPVKAEAFSEYCGSTVAANMDSDSIASLCHRLNEARERAKFLDQKAAVEAEVARLLADQED